MEDFKNKYLKYKYKYLVLAGGGDNKKKNSRPSTTQTAWSGTSDFLRKSAGKSTGKSTGKPTGKPTQSSEYSLHSPLTDAYGRSLYDNKPISQDNTNRAPTRRAKKIQPTGDGQITETTRKYFERVQTIKEKRKNDEKKILQQNFIDNLQRDMINMVTTRYIENNHLNKDRLTEKDNNIIKLLVGYINQYYNDKDNFTSNKQGSVFNNWVSIRTFLKNHNYEDILDDFLKKMNKIKIGSIDNDDDNPDDKKQRDRQQDDGDPDDKKQRDRQQDDGDQEFVGDVLREFDQDYFDKLYNSGSSRWCMLQAFNGLLLNRNIKKFNELNEKDYRYTIINKFVSVNNLPQIFQLTTSFGNIHSTMSQNSTVSEISEVKINKYIHCLNAFGIIVVDGNNNPIVPMKTIVTDK